MTVDPVAGSRTVEVDGSPVHVTEVGSGPPVLLLHGSGPGTTGSGAWAATARALGTTRRLVMPDQAGFGGTPVPPGSSGGLRLWTAQAVALVDALDLAPCAVVGHSMGGAVALALAAERPGQVDRVVGVSSMGTPGAPLAPALDALWATTPESGLDGARAMVRHLLHGEEHVTDEVVRARAEAIAAGAAAYAPLFPPPRQRWADDLASSPDALASITAPVLLVHGAQDTVTPLADWALPLLDLLPDVRMHVLGRCGHVPQLEHPEAFQRLLDDFLA